MEALRPWTAPRWNGIVFVPGVSYNLRGKPVFGQHVRFARCSAPMAAEPDSQVVLRPFRPEDLPALVDVYMAAYREHPEYGEPDERHAMRYLRWLLRHHTLFLVAEAAGRPVGFVVVDAGWRDWNGRRVGEIHELVVHPDYWGKGIGRQLVEAALAHVREQGLRRAGLWVGMRNERALAFYRRLGFRRSKMRWGEWIRMVKSV